MRICYALLHYFLCCTSKGKYRKQWANGFIHVSMTDPMETDHINQLYPLRQWFDDVYFEEGRKANTGGTSSIGGHGRTPFVAIRPCVFWIWLQELETQNTFANGSDYICNSHPKCMITTSDTKTIEVFVVLTCSRQHWLVIVMLWLFYFKTNLDNLAPCSTNYTDRIFFR